MAKRAEALIVRNTPYGRRLLPTTKAEAQELVDKEQATLLKPGLYNGTKTAHGQKTRSLTTSGASTTSRSKRS